MKDIDLKRLDTYWDSERHLWIDPLLEDRKVSERVNNKGLSEDKDSLSEKLNSLRLKRNEEGWNLIEKGLGLLTKGVNIVEEKSVVDAQSADPSKDYEYSVFKKWVHMNYFSSLSKDSLSGSIKALASMLKELKECQGYDSPVVITRYYDFESNKPKVGYKPLYSVIEGSEVCPECGIRVMRYLDVCECGHQFEDKPSSGRFEDIVSSPLLSKRVVELKGYPSKTLTRGALEDIVNTLGLVGEVAIKGEKGIYSFRDLTLCCTPYTNKDYDLNFTFDTKAPTTTFFLLRIRLYPDTISVYLYLQGIKSLLEINRDLVQEGFLRFYKLIEFIGGLEGADKFYRDLKDLGLSYIQQAIKGIGIYRIENKD